MNEAATNQFPTYHQISLDEFDAGKINPVQNNISAPVQVLHNLAPGHAIMIYHPHNPFSTLSSAASRLRTQGKADIELKKCGPDQTMAYRHEREVSDNKDIETLVADLQQAQHEFEGIIRTNVKGLPYLLISIGQLSGTVYISDEGWVLKYPLSGRRDVFRAKNMKELHGVVERLRELHGYVPNMVWVDRHGRVFGADEMNDEYLLAILNIENKGVGYSETNKLQFVRLKELALERGLL